MGIILKQLFSRRMTAEHPCCWSDAWRDIAKPNMQQRNGVEMSKTCSPRDMLFFGLTVNILDETSAKSKLSSSGTTAENFLASMKAAILASRSYSSFLMPLVRMLMMILGLGPYFFNLEEALTFPRIEFFESTGNTGMNTSWNSGCRKAKQTSRPGDVSASESAQVSFGTRLFLELESCKVTPSGRKHICFHRSGKRQASADGVDGPKHKVRIASFLLS